MRLVCSALALGAASTACDPASREVLRGPEPTLDAGVPDGAGGGDAAVELPRLSVVGSAATEVGQPFDLEWVARSAALPIAWTVAAGTLPDGVRLEPASETDVARLVGAPARVGRYDVELEIRDARGETARVAAALRVVGALAIETSPLPPATLGETYSATIAAEGGAGELTWRVPADALPDGIALVESGDRTVELRGMPSSEGTYAFDVTTRDERGTSATASFGIDVASNPVISTMALPDGTLGQSYTGSIRASGGAAPYAWSVGADSRLPPGLQLEGESGSEVAVAGIAGRQGTFWVEAEVRDADGRQASAKLFFQVFDSGFRLAVDGPPRVDVAACAPIDLTFRAVGGGRVGIEWEVRDLPSGLSSRALEGGVLRVFGFLDEGEYPPFVIDVDDAAGEQATLTVAVDVSPRTTPRWAALTWWDASANETYVGALDLCSTEPSSVAARLSLEGLRSDVVFSPSGRRFAAVVSTTSTEAIATWDVSGSNPTHAEFTLGEGLWSDEPVFATDDRLLFYSDYAVEFLPGIFIPRKTIGVVDLDARRREARVVAPTGNDQEISSVSPDGRWLVFSELQSEDLWLVDLEDPAAEAERLACSDGSGFGVPWSTWAPRGRQLVYRCGTTLALMTLTVSASGPGPAVDFPGEIASVPMKPRSNRWMPFDSADGGVTLIDLDPAHFGMQTEIDFGQPFNAVDHSPSPDERHLLFKFGSDAFLVRLSAPGAPAPPAVSPSRVGFSQRHALVATRFSPDGDTLLWFQPRADATRANLQVRRLRPSGTDLALGPAPSMGSIAFIPGTKRFVASSGSELLLYDLSVTTRPIVWRRPDAAAIASWARPDGAGVFFDDDAGRDVRLSYLNLLGDVVPTAHEVPLGGGEFRMLVLPPR